HLGSPAADRDGALYPRLARSHLHALAQHGGDCRPLRYGIALCLPWGSVPLACAVRRVLCRHPCMDLLESAHRGADDETLKRREGKGIIPAQVCRSATKRAAILSTSARSPNTPSASEASATRLLSRSFDLAMPSTPTMVALPAAASLPVCLPTVAV